MCFVDEDIHVVAQAAIFANGFKLVDHRDHKAAIVRIQQGLKFSLVFGAGDSNVLLLHFTQQPLNPSLQLAFKLGAVNNQNHSGISKLGLVFKDLPCCG